MTDEFINPDPVDWILTHFRVPETPDRHLILADYQRAALAEALAVEPDGTFRYSVIVWSDIKKSIKSTITAAVALWRAFQLDWGQIVLVANDLKQADSRVGYYVRRAIELNPKMKAVVKIIQNKVILPNHTYIESVPIDPTGEAGGNADMIVFSELWGAHQKAQARMWTEQTLSPTKYGYSFRWIETYAGFSGESPTLEQLYDQGVKHGAQFEWAKRIDPPLPAYHNDTAKMFCMWNDRPRLPWQSQEYYAQEAGVLVENEFERIHRNKWASSTDVFVPLAWWEACLDTSMPALGENQPIVVALDAAVSGDCFGMVGVSGRGNGQLDVRYVRKWTPPLGGKINFEEVDAEVKRMIDNYNVIMLPYDPFQLEDMAGRLQRNLIVTVYAFSQASERLISDKNLHDMIRDRRIHHSGEPDLKEHIQNANRQTDHDKLRIVKRSESLKIDLAVALSMAAAQAQFWNL